MFTFTHITKESWDHGNMHWADRRALHFLMKERALSEVAAAEPGQHTATTCPHISKHLFKTEISLRPNIPRNTHTHLCYAAFNDCASWARASHKSSHKSLNHGSKDVSTSVLMRSGREGCSVWGLRPEPSAPAEGQQHSEQLQHQWLTVTSKTCIPGRKSKTQNIYFF